MPASYVHQCVAARACAALPFASDPRLYAALLAGAEGPDPLFFSLLAVPSATYPPKVGGLLHTHQTDTFMLALCEACRNDALLRAYCCGFFTHYATDTTFHPFVYAHSLTPKGAYSPDWHCRLEHQLETLHYRREGHATGVPEQMAGLIALSAQDKDAIAAALHGCIAQVFAENAPSRARVRRSFEDAISICRALRSPDGQKYRKLSALCRPLGLETTLHAHMMPPEPPAEDIANDAHRPWTSPWRPEDVRTEGFSELYAAATSRAQTLAEAAFDAMRGTLSPEALRALHGGLSYDSGVPWRESCPVQRAFDLHPRT